MPSLQPTSGSSTSVPPSLEEAWLLKHKHDSFVPVRPPPRSKASCFQGKKEGWFFGTGDSGLGYYRYLPTLVQVDLHQALGLFSGGQPTTIALASVVPATGISEASRSVSRLHAHVATCLKQIQHNLNAMLGDKAFAPSIGTVTLDPEHPPAPRPPEYVQQLHPDAVSTTHALISNSGNNSNAHSIKHNNHRDVHQPPRKKLFG